MNYKKSFALLALVLGCATSAAAHAHSCSALHETAPFSLDQYLDVSFHSGDDRQYRGKESLDATVIAIDQVVAKSLPVNVASDPLAPLQSFSVIGKWWNLLGELAANPGVVWRYKDFFAVFDEDGVKYEIDRKALADYPDLQRRLRAARPSFDRIEIDVYGAHDIRVTHSAYDPRIRFIIEANDVIVPPEQSDPYMVPMSPERWEDRLRIDRLEGEDLIKEWANIKGVRCPQVTIRNLRLPTAALVGIAKDLKKYRDADSNLEEFAEYARKGYKLEPAGKPYSGPKRNLEPLIAPPQHAEIEWQGERQLVLREKRKGSAEAAGKVLFSSNEYSYAYYVDKDRRYFLLRKSNGESHIVNARGQKMTISGLDTFASAWLEGEDKLHLYPVYRSRDNLVYKTKFFFQQRDAPEEMSPAEFENFKVRDRALQPCPYRPKGGGVALSSPWYRWDYHRIRAITVDRSLKPLADGDVIIRGESYPSRRGDQVCR